jgi:hypothetical protein
MRIKTTNIEYSPQINKMKDLQKHLIVNNDSSSLHLDIIQ